MGIDIRLPLGALFALLGLILTLYGAFSDSSVYQQSLGIDINLRWGVALLAFGIVMLLLGWRGAHSTAKGKGILPPSRLGH